MTKEELLDKYFPASDGDKEYEVFRIALYNSYISKAMEEFGKQQALGFMQYYWKFKEVNGHKLNSEEWPTEEKLYEMFINNVDVNNYKYER